MIARVALVAAAATLLAACAAGGAATPGVATTTRPAAPTPVPTPTPLPKLTLAGLFHPTAPPPPAPAGTQTWTLNATGDTIPARLVNIAANQRGDFLFPFRPTADYVKNADVTFVNLESPLLAGCPARAGGLVFCGDTRFVD